MSAFRWKHLYGALMGMVADRCVWISPGDSRAGPPRTSEAFAEALAPRVTVLVKTLEIWHHALSLPYDLLTEVRGVERFVAARSTPKYHLFGFSAGATVALAVAMAFPDRVRSLTLLEPASIGDDDWDPVEVRWRADLARVRSLPGEERRAAFRRLMMRPGDQPPPSRVAHATWDRYTDKLEDALAAVGFGTPDLARIQQPTMVITCGRSHPRFLRLSQRLVQVIPGAYAEEFAECSHLAPPQHHTPERLAEALLRLWIHAEDAGGRSGRSQGCC